VMKGGHIVESGSHDELLAEGGLYSQSWRAQVQMEPETSDRQAAIV
jgi:ABC-type multidrug transport system fused ATPase/permease subunit